MPPSAQAPVPPPLLPPDPSAPPTTLAQPVYAPQVASAPSQVAGQQVGIDPGRTLAIIGLVLAFIFSLGGLALSIIAYSQSKKAGFKNSIALIGIWISGAFVLLGGLIYLYMFFTVVF